MFEKNLRSLQTKPVPKHNILSERKEVELLKNVLRFFNKTALLKAVPVEEKTYVSNWIFGEQEEKQVVEQTHHLIKYNDHFTVYMIKTALNNDKAVYNFRAIALDVVDGNTIKKIALFENKELQIENVFKSDEDILELPIYSEPNEDSENNVSTQAWEWDDCWIDGCCSFRYKGLPWNPVVHYKWCGKGCGSGIPENGLDECCKVHDGCYSGKTYPAKCNCDKALAICAGKTDFAGSDRVYGAAIALLTINNCPK